MKIQTLYKYLLAVVMFMTATACNDEDFLNQAKMASLNVGDDAVDNTIALENLISGAYYSLSNFGGGNGFHGRHKQVAELMADVLVLHENQPNVSNSELNYYGRTTSVNDDGPLADVWQCGYRVAHAANRVIGVIERTGGFRDGNFSWTPVLLGEALFLRAFAHFQLVKLFSAPYGGANNGRPSIIKMDRLPVDGFDLRGRATVQEIYDFIVADLERILQQDLLPETFNATFHPPGYVDRAKKDAVRFLLMRVYWMRHEFDKAKNMADAIIASGGGFDLSEAPIEAFNKANFAPGGTTYASNVRGKEVIFQIIMFNAGARQQSEWKSADQVLQSMSFSFTGGVNQNTWSTNNNQKRVSFSQDFMLKSGWVDPVTKEATAEALNDKRLQQVYRRWDAGTDNASEYHRNLTEPYIWGSKMSRTDLLGGQPRRYSYTLFRLAEVYLTRAYINFANGQTQAAANDLDVVRRRAWAGDLADFQVTDPASLTAEKIHIERAKEMAFEDDRLWYLKGLMADVPPGDRNTSALAWDSERLYWPIPQRETTLNSLLGE